MGCALSSSTVAKPQIPSDRAHRNRNIDSLNMKKNKVKQPSSINKLTNHNPFARNGGQSSTAFEFIGKQRYIGDAGGVMMEMQKGDGSCRGTLIVFAAVSNRSIPGALRCGAASTRLGGEGISMTPNGITFVFRDDSGHLFVKEIPDSELAHEKASAMVTYGWAPFFKSIASDVIKYKATMVHTTRSRKEIKFNIRSAKDPTIQPYLICLELRSESPTSKEQLAFVIEPMTKMVQIRRIRNNAREQQVSGTEIRKTVSIVNTENSKLVIESTLKQLSQLRDEAAAVSKLISDQQTQLLALERRIQKTKAGVQHSLDNLYTVGALPSHHSGRAEHLKSEPNESLADVLREIFPLSADDLPEDNIGEIAILRRTPNDPCIQRVMTSCPKTMVDGVLNVLKRIDCWDLDVFQLEEATGGNALFYITYTLLYKMDFVRQFNIDDRILRNFLKAVQSGYHPNPYHNKTHAADVTHINYYIMVPCGLGKKCQLPNVVLLGGILAGAIHDFDHPGLNNNFHTRTNAYLATLYNDRSILENHHCACVFEILRLPQYNIFTNMSQEDYLTIRDTIIEMVLATDMGNHAKICNEFKKRLQEDHDWFTKNEDVKMALSMTIKMSDISNSGRPKPLYLEWAQRIADEFYQQGDLEQNLKMSISPFMNRAKHDSDFATGQKSFMSYVVMPMIETMATLLPKFGEAIDLCNKNKAHWE